MDPQELTFEEKKAAEAAFRGLPVEPHWSEKARAVYEGIMKARGGTLWPSEAGPQPTPAIPAEDLREAGAGMEKPASKPEATECMPSPHPGQAGILQAGILVDLTPLAQEAGLPWPVVMSKPLWDFAIRASGAVPAEQYPERLRTILKALQHCLTVSPVLPQVIMFHVPLLFPSEPAARSCRIFAAVHKHPSGQSFTLLRPEEPWATDVTAAIRPA